MRIDIKWRREGGIAIAALLGRIDSSNSNHLLTMLEEGFEPENRALLLDFERVSFISACQKMILVVGLYDEFGYLGADLIILGGFGQDLACIWGSDRIGVVRAGG